MLPQYRNGKALQAVCELSGQSYGFASESFGAGALKVARSGPRPVGVCLANTILRIHIVRQTTRRKYHLRVIRNQKALIAVTLGDDVAIAILLA
jgi:hypothetical protein